MVPPQPELQQVAATSPGTRLLLVCSDDSLGGDVMLASEAVGFDCDACESHQAIQVLQSHHYVAVFVDVGDKGDDFSLIEAIRGATRMRQVPIVTISHPSDVNAAFRAGASFALARPINFELLKNTLAALYRIAVGQQRQYERYRVEMPLTLTIDDVTMQGKATDLGHGGVAFVTAEPLQSCTVVTVRFTLPGSEEQIIAVGEIRWSDHHGRAGLCFTSIAGTGRAALDNWIARRHAGISDPSPPPPRDLLPLGPWLRARSVPRMLREAPQSLRLARYWRHFACSSWDSGSTLC